MFTYETMFIDEEDINPLYDIADGTALVEEPTYAGHSVSGRGVKHVIDRRPTTEEAQDRLWAGLPRPLRPLVRKQFPKRRKLHPVLIPFYAFELAELLIEIDPLDRIQD